MNAEQYRRAKGLFLELCELDAEARERRIGELEDGTEVLGEVRSLLEFYEQPLADELDPTPPLHPTAPGPPDPDPFFAAGTMIGERYRIIRRLGRGGGKGTVFQADDLQLGAAVALKLLPLDGDGDGDVHRVLHEIRLVRQVTHPNVCRVFDLDELEGRPFLSMEYVDGEDLRSLMSRIGRLPQDRTVRVARQLFAGLAAAHTKGVLHRDLKPANVMIDGKGDVRITDFGIAAIEGRTSGPAAGADRDPRAPEVAAGEPATERSDLYSMGLLLYETCTGVHPLDLRTSVAPGSDRARVPVPPPSTLVEDLDPELERLILACLEPRPQDRPAGALAVAAALPGTEDPLTLAVSVGGTPTPEMVSRAGGRPRLAAGPATALVLTAIVLLVLVVLLADSARRLDQVDMALPPEVLAQKAREKLRLLGWSQPAEDSAYGFLENGYALAALAAGDPDSGVAYDPAAPAASTVLFWYRQSPETMVPSGLENLVTFSAEVGPYDPKPSRGGDALVLLSPQGGLDHLEILPPRTPDAAPERSTGPAFGSPEAVPESPLETLLTAAGLEQSSLREVPVEFTPPFFADRRRAWIGASEQRPDLPLDVRTAFYGDLPVYFRMVPAASPGPEEGSTWLLSLIDEWNEWWDLIFVLSVLAAIPLMRYNLRGGRGDQRSARRLAGFVVALNLATWILRGPHVADVGTEWALAQLRLGHALLQGALVWILYLALEPYVRRVWPQVLIAWTRLLDGGRKDPVVGSSVLWGVIFGAAWALLDHLDRVLPPWLGLAIEAKTVDAPQFDYALSAGQTAAGAGDLLLAGIHEGVFSLLLLVLLRLVLPSRWAVGVAYVLLVGALYAHEGAHPTVSWLTLGLATASLEVFALMRFGLVTYTVAAFCGGLLTAFPLTLDLSAWYAGTGLTAVAVPGLLVLWGAAVAGPRLSIPRIGPEDPPSGDYSAQAPAHRRLNI